MNPSIAILLAVYAAASGIGASVTLEVTFTTTPDRRARNCGSTACVIAITPKVLVSNTSRTVAIGVASKTPMTPMPALLTSTSSGPARLDRGGDALGPRHVERQDAQPLRSGQNVFARRSHGGDHVPALRVKVARGLEAIAGRAAGNEHGVHGRLLFGFHLRGPVHDRDVAYYSGGVRTIYNVESIFHL